MRSFIHEPRRARAYLGRPDKLWNRNRTIVTATGTFNPLVAGLNPARPAKVSPKTPIFTGWRFCFEVATLKTSGSSVLREFAWCFIALLLTFSPFHNMVGVNLLV